MKLETKLGISTAIMILAMFLSAFVAHIHIQESNRLSAIIFNGRVPLISLCRDVRFAPMISVRALESYLLLGTDPVSSAKFRKERSDKLAAGEVAVERLLKVGRQYDLGNVAGSVQSFQTLLGQLKDQEEETERLNELHTPEGSKQAKLVETAWLSVNVS